MNNGDKETVSEEYKKHVDEAAGDYNVNKGKFRSTAAKILCVLAAMLLWFYVTAAETELIEKEFTALPIVFENEDILVSKGIGNVINPENYKVDITVRGPKRKVEKLTVDDITAFVDVSTVTKVGEYHFTVQTKLPDGIDRVRESSSVITANIDKTETKAVKLELLADWSLDADCYAPENEWEYPKTIDIKGPSTVVNSIVKANVTLNLGKLNQSVTMTVTDITYYDKDGVLVDSKYISRTDDKEVQVYVPVYMEREVPLVIRSEYKYLNSEYVNISISPKTLTVKGDPLAVKSVDKITIKPLDEKAYYESSGDFEFLIEKPSKGKIMEEISTVSVNISHRNSSIVTVELNVDSMIPTVPGTYSYSASPVELRFRVLGNVDPSEIITDSMLKITMDYPTDRVAQSGYYKVKLERTAIPLPDYVLLIEPEEGYEAYITVTKNEDSTNTNQ